MENKKEALAAIFGQENLIDDTEKLAAYSKSEGFVKGFSPDYIVKAEKASQVQELVKWANETKNPIIPVSSGGKHRRGGTVPAVPEAVIVDLSGMKKVFSVNSLYRMAVFEPGLTYSELAPELAKEGLMIDTSLAPRGEKSVISSILETDPRLNPNMQWCVLDPLRCLETVWGDGTLMRTGEAFGTPVSKEPEEAIKLDQENHGYMIAPAGPDCTDYYRLLSGAQGTMGIVTWASMKCALLPEIHEMMLVPSNDLSMAIEFMYNLEHIRFGDSLFLLNSYDFASLMCESPAEIEALAKELPNWICCASAASRPPLPEKRVSSQKAGIISMASKAGLEAKQGVAGIPASAVLKKAFSPCEPGKYWKDTYKGASADIIFLTTMDQVPKFTAKMFETAANEGFNTAEIGVYVQPKHQGANCSVEFTIPYDPGRESDMAKAEKLFNKAAKELSDIGAFYSRPYGKWARMQLGKDAMTTATLKKLKGIFDPNGIMNTGRLSAY